MRCRTSLVCTAVLHSYALLVCRQHRRPPFVRVAEPHWYAPLSYIRTRCSYAVDIADLCSYVLQNLAGMHRCLHLYALLVCHQHRRTPFVRIAEPRLYVPLSYIRTRCSSAFYIADLRSYAVQNLVGMHRCPTFVRAARLRSTSLTSVHTRCRISLVCTAVYIRMRCSSAVNIADLRSYVLQNLVGMHRCPTFVRAARLPSTSLTSVRTRCRTSLVCSAVLHSYALLVCRHSPRCSTSRTHCSFGLIFADLRSDMRINAGVCVIVLNLECVARLASFSLLAYISYALRAFQYVLL